MLRLFLQVTLSLSVLTSACHVLTFPPSLATFWQVAHNPVFLWTGPWHTRGGRGGNPAHSAGLPKCPRILSPTQGALPTSRPPGWACGQRVGPGPSRRVGAPSTPPCALWPQHVRGLESASPASSMTRAAGWPLAWAILSSHCCCKPKPLFKKSTYTKKRTPHSRYPCFPIVIGGIWPAPPKALWTSSFAL